MSSTEKYVSLQKLDGRPDFQATGNLEPPIRGRGRHLGKIPGLNSTSLTCGAASLTAGIRMAVVLRLVGISLLMQGCLSSVGRVNGGCKSLTRSGDLVCCEACFPGHHLVTRCGPSAEGLCTPCESGTYSSSPQVYSCSPCKQCVGAQVYVKECTPTSDTKCGCKPGLMCGDSGCSFCIKKCVEGEEPTVDRFCRPCPPGTFNDQGHQKCKPWKTKCPDFDQYIEANGTAYSDIKCVKVSVSSLQNPSKPGATDQTLPLVLSVVISLALMSVIVIVVVVIAVRRDARQAKTHKTHDMVTNTSINIDYPLPLRAVECSFHEAEQEQGSSSESLDDKDSSHQLIA